MEHWLWILLAALVFECKGEDRVMQPSGDVIETEGNTVILNCNFETNRQSPTLFWYKQEDNSRPKYLLKVYSRTVEHAAVNLKDRFDAELKDRSVPLKIQKLELSDSAVFYCALNTGSYNNLMFGRGARLTVEAKQEIKPSYYKLEDGTTKACLATGFTRHNGAQGHGTYSSDFTNASEAVRPPGSGLYSQVIFPNDVSKCEESTQVSRESVGDLEPDETVNLAALITMGLRVIFIKTVVFNVLMTLRLWISQ